MDISDIFEIYDIKKIGDDGQVLVTLCTTEFRGGGYVPCPHKLDQS